VATNFDASHRVRPPLKLKACHPQTSPRLGLASVPRNGLVQREQEAWQDEIFFLSLTAHCIVGKGPRFIRKNDALNTTERCVCSMPPALLTVARVPCASTVKDMAFPPKNLVVSALFCIPCLSQRRKSRRLRAFLPLIPSSGGIGRALSLVEPGFVGNAATW
jgi:hypothetical protein